MKNDLIIFVALSFFSAPIVSPVASAESNPHVVSKAAKDQRRSAGRQKVSKKTSKKISKKTSRYDPTNYLAKKDGGTPTELGSTPPSNAAIEAPHGTARSLVDCKPEQPAAADDTAPATGEEVVIQEDGKDKAAPQAGLLGSTDLAKALVNNAKKNCKPTGSTDDGGVSVSVSRGQAEDGTEETGLRAMRPTIGFSKNF